MNKFLKVFFVAIASPLMMQPMPAPAEPLPAPIPLNDYLGEWSATAAPYAAGNVVIHASKTWLSVINGNRAEPGGIGTDGPWRMLGDANSFRYKVGDKGPGGGWIFFVDRAEEFPGFTYLEAAPEDVGNRIWCDQGGVSIPGAKALGIGQGEANTRAMLAVCARGAAQSAQAYRGPKGKSDWFLPSLGELKLMNKWFAEHAKGGFRYKSYWSSSEFASTDAWYREFNYDGQDHDTKSAALRVRPVRAF